jgi:pimeloyl-ACP methyl ester carboxylesterase
MDVEYRTINVRGSATAYIEAGPADAPPVVLLHDGSPGSDALSCWKSIIPQLAKDFRVLAPDLMGAGRSEKLVLLDTDFYTYSIAQVRAFCDILGAERPSMVGASLGGGIVLQIMSRRAFPVRSGTSIAGPGGRYMDQAGLTPIREYEPTPEGALAVERTLVREPEPAEVEYRLQNTLQPGHLEAFRARVIHGPAVLPPPETGDDDPHTAMLRRIDTPTLLIAGGADPLVEPGWADRVAENLSDARVAAFGDALHLPHRDHPAEIASLIAEHAAASR